jgi:thymidylate synthase
LISLSEQIMRLLAIVNGPYGRRHVANVQAHGPAAWSLAVWEAPAFFPPVIDYPEEYLPPDLPAADLILAFAEHKGVAELLPDVAERTGATAVLAPVDNEAWLPRGLARQLHGWLAKIGVACATPKPLCSLTEQDYGVTRRQRATYDSPLIAEFARYFGQPRLRITVNEETKLITAVSVERDAVCGCTRHVAAALVGMPAANAAEQAGLLHHHFPCLASMSIDPDFSDTLMHVSGNVLKDEVAQQVRPYRAITYITPGKRGDSDRPTDLPRHRPNDQF